MRVVRLDFYAVRQKGINFAVNTFGFHSSVSLLNAVSES